MIKLETRNATLDDSALYLEWRNDQEVRDSAFTTDIISNKMHDEWFQKKLLDKKSELLLVFENAKPVGQVRFEFSDDYSMAEINYSIAKVYRGKGLATPMMDEAIRVLCCKSKIGIKLIAKVKIENIASSKVFERLKFNRIQQNEKTMHVFELLKK